MRYFKCNEPTDPKQTAVTLTTELTKEQKKKNRRGNFLNIIATVLLFTIGIGGFIGCCYMIAEIPSPQNPFFFVLSVIGMVILGFGALIVSFLLGTLVTSPIFKKSEKYVFRPKKTVLTPTCMHLREYYGWKEPCIVTKCYNSSDESFKSRDVCIFVAGDELRITSNLKYGFSDREKDLGCYAFTLDEISLRQIQGEQFLITELKTGGAAFFLGRRAKNYIEYNFTKINNTR